MTPALSPGPDASPGHHPRFPGARPALLLLLGINLFNYIDRNVLASVVPWIKEAFFDANGAVNGSPALTGMLQWSQQHLGFKPENALIGVLGTAFMVIYTIGAPVFGRLAERNSRWLLVGIGVVLWSLASGASGLAGTFLVLLVTRCFVGVGEAAYGPVAPAIISDFYPVRVRGQVLAWFYMATPVGSALGYVLGESVANSHLGHWGAGVFGGSAESWRWAFYLVVGPGILLGVCSFFMREPPRGQADLARGAAPAPVRWRDYAILLRTPSYVFCTLGMTAMTFAIGGIAFWMPSFLKGRPGTGNAPITTFGALLVVTGIIATYLGGFAGDRLRQRFPGSYFLVSSVAMLAGFPFILAVLRAPFPLGWVFVFLACFCLFFNTGPTNTILANVTHPGIRAAAFALNIFVIHAFGDVVSPVIVGIISDRFSMTTAFVVVGVMFVVAGGFWLADRAMRDRFAAAARTRLSQSPSAGPAAPCL